MILLFHIGFLPIDWKDIVDITLVTLLFYHIYRLIKGSIAVKIFMGLLSVYFIYQVVRAMKLDLLTSILDEFIKVGVVATIILFQQEIRKFLIVLGKTALFSRENIFSIFFKRKISHSKTVDVNMMVDLAKNLSSTYTGALIVFTKNSELNFYAESGDILDALVSKRILISIFNKTSPLHDGAVIISDNKIVAARCILPVSENENLPAFLGLRHRAALGMTEVNDSIVLVVSEESGSISLSRNGKLYHNLTPQELSKRLTLFLNYDEEFITKEILQENIQELKLDTGNVFRY